MRKKLISQTFITSFSFKLKSIQGFQVVDIDSFSNFRTAATFVKAKRPG